MRVLVVLIVAAAILAVPAFAAGQVAVGIGGQSAGNVEGLSIKAKIAGPLTLQGIVGYSSMGMEDPTVEVEGENQEDVPMSLTSSSWAFGGRALFTAAQSGNVDVYLGAGFMYHLMDNTLEFDVDFRDRASDHVEVTVDGNAMEFSGMFGVECRFDDMPNAAVSAEVGYSYMMYGTFEGTASADGDEAAVTLEPNATEHGFYVGVGMHYYF